MTRTPARTPMWFDADDAPVFGWLHAPDDQRVRGGVLICPSLGAELVSAHPAMRLLADRLAGAGFAALRFDYPGTGDSAGDLSDAAAVAALAPSVTTAARTLREFGCEWVAAVGLRVGAALAATASASGPADALVLWDPCDGDRFLREAAVRYRLTTGQEHSGDDVHSVGFVYRPSVAAALRALAFGDVPHPPGIPVLGLVRPGRVRPGVRRFLDAAGATVAEAAGQADLLEVPTVDRRMPEAAIECMVAWLDAAGPRAKASLRLDGVRPSARIGEVTERFVELGPLRLFGVRTDPAGDGIGPLAVLLNVAAEHHIGPGRLWVELARRWAADGTPVLRLDLAGLGDSPTRPGSARDQVYDPDHLDDLPMIAAALRADGFPAVMPMGLCSGAYHALEWAIHAGADAVVAINPVLGLPLPEAIAQGDVDPRRSAAHTPRPLFRRLSAAKRLGALKQHLPPWVWRVLDRLGLHPMPTAGLERAVNAGVDTLMISSVFDAATYQRRGARSLRRLEATGRFRLSVVPDIDHSLQVAHARSRVAADLTEFVTARRAAARASAPLATTGRGGR